MANFPGTAGDDPLVGTNQDDTFDLTLGGNDSVTAGAGDDLIMAGAAFNALDAINGGTGHDKLDLLGNYAAGVVFKATTLRNVEEIHVGSGFSYNLTTHDGTIAAGAVLKIDGYNMSAGQSLIVDGSAETDGSFLFYDGQSNDTFIGGAQADNFGMAYDGSDTIHAGGGGDVITAYNAFDSTDHFDGGDGSDVLYLSGAKYGAGFAINGNMMTNIETLGLSGENTTFAIVMDDTVVKAGENLYVSAEGISGTGFAIFNGAAETDGTFSFRDSIGNDSFTGGANDDVFLGVSGGHDTFQGVGGGDTFYMYGNLDALDEIYGGAGEDSVVLNGDYSGGITFDMFTLNSIEALSTYDGHNYNITTHEATVGPGKTFTVSAGYLSAPYHITFDGSAETDGAFNFYGGGGGDNFTGGAGNDYFDAHNGGDDRFYGGAGDDAVSFFDAYTTSDFADGGDGSDSVYLYGDFAGGLDLGAAQFRNIESITLGSGFSYNVTTRNNLVASGATLAFDTYYSAAGENFVFDGSAETDGHFNLTGGDGDDSLTGGAQSDKLFLNRGGIDAMFGGGGDDQFFVSSGFTAADSLEGGTGFDAIKLSADLGGPFKFAANTIQNIEQINLYTGRSYNIISDDANVAAGRNLTVDGHFLGAAEMVKFNGSAETDGRFTLISGAADDKLIGGDKNDTLKGNDGDDLLQGNDGRDTLVGGHGSDDMYGGAGNDFFVFTSVADMGMGAASDTIHDWNAGDLIDLSPIDTSIMAGDQAFTFVGGNAFSASGVAEVRVFDNGTATFVRGDINGDGTTDFQIKLDGVHALTAADFLL